MTRTTVYVWLLLLMAGTVFSGCKRDNIVKECCEPTPLFLQFGPAPRLYNNIIIDPVASPEISDEFLQRWEQSKAAVMEIAGGPRTLQDMRIDFISETQLTITYGYTTAAGSRAIGVVTYNYSFDSRGFLRLAFAARTANGRILAPAIFPMQEDYLERYGFKLDWMEDKVPGSTGKKIGLFKDGSRGSYLGGAINGQ